MKEYLSLVNNAFEQSELKDYLGKGVVDSLIEWFPNGESLLTKTRLISMIDSLYGTEILKDKSFREGLLLSMKYSDLIDIRDNCLSGNEKGITEHIELAKAIANKPWKKSPVSLKLIEKWGVSEDIFEKEIDDTQVCNVLSSPDQRFFELLDYQYYIKQRVLNNLNTYELERMLIHMPTGTGKTKTSMHIITHYLEFVMKKKGIVVWVAHTTELLEQAYDTFKTVWSHLGNGEINAYKLWGNKTIESLDDELSGIAFCGLAKLMSIHNNNNALWDRLKKDCRLIVFDEAHKAGIKYKDWEEMYPNHVIIQKEGFMYQAHNESAEIIAEVLDYELMTDIAGRITTGGPDSSKIGFALEKANHSYIIIEDEQIIDQFDAQ